MNSDEVIDYYRHKHSTDPGFCKGSALLKHLPRLASYIQDFRYRSVLDYGCGKASFWKQDSRVWRAMFCCVPGEDFKLTLYDPGIEGQDTLPTSRHDLVICCDVMEHVLEQDVPDTLDTIFSLTRKTAFLNISTVPASKKFPNGTNLHVTIKSRSWWMDQIRQSEKRILSKTGQYINVAVLFDE